MSNPKETESEKEELKAEDEISDSETPTTSEMALELKDIQRATVDAASRRERLPQPLFWSLFHSRIKELKDKKRKQRILEEFLD